MGYGANQKSCYKIAIDLKSDIIIMLHPDYQYSPKLIRAMASLIADNVYEVVMGSRILGKGSLAGGMPIYKYISNRVLTFIQNILITKSCLSIIPAIELFSANALKSIAIDENSNDFIFDNQIIVQLHYKNFCYSRDNLSYKILR